MYNYFFFLGFSTTFANEPDVDDLLAIMKDAVHTKKNKNVDILLLASQICRRLHGMLNMDFQKLIFWTLLLKGEKLS